MMTLDEMRQLESFLNNNCEIPEPADFRTPEGVANLAKALDRLMPACKTLLVMLLQKEKL